MGPTGSARPPNDMEPAVHRLPSDRARAESASPHPTPGHAAHSPRAPRARRAAAAVLVAALTGLAGLGAASPAAASDEPGWAEKALTPDHGLLFGASVTRGSYAKIGDAVSAFESTIGRRLDLHRWYARWDEPFPGTPVTDSIAAGRTPVLSVSSQRGDGSKISWASIADGDQDARIVEQAAAIRALDVPLYLSFQHEPDYSPGYGTPDEYRAAFRHYVEVFRAQGVTNVVWTWIVTPAAFYTSGAGSAAALYPGDDVVDWVGLDAYNWNGCSTNGQDTWRTMAQIAGPARDFARAHAKELMLAEWGSFEDAADPDRKAAWFRESMATLASWPEVKAVLYFNHVGTCSWFVDSSPSSLAAFTEVANSAVARTRASAYLTASTVHGSAPLDVSFDGSRSTGADGATGTNVAGWTLDLGDGTTRTGTGTPPSTLDHTYAAGTYEARLTVTDTSGGTSSDTQTVTAAAAPTVTGAQRDVTTTSATLYAWADLHQYAGSVTFEWGTTPDLGTQAVVAVPNVSYIKTVAQPVTGLQPGTTYYVRTTATTAAGSTVLTSTFQTAGKPTSSSSFTTDTTATSTTFKAQVHPHLLATTTWLEWGTTAQLGRTSPVTALPAGLTYEKTVSSGTVSGLAPNTTVYYRVVAQNAQGTLYGPVQTKKTLR
jgi:hypothetical protein